MIVKLHFDREGFSITDKQGWKNTIPFGFLKSSVDDGVIYSIILYCFCLRVGFEK